MQTGSATPVLVTGALGAIGSWVVRRLVEQGQPFIVYDQREDFSLVADLVGQFRFVAGDILDGERLKQVVRDAGVRRIIHLAALMPPACEADPRLGFQVNFMGSLTVFDVARDLGLERVVFGSSKAVYGAIGGEHLPPTFVPVTEDYAGPTRDVYGSTKRALEDAARHYRRLWDLDLIALRFGNTYGPGKLERHGVVGILSRFIEMGFRGEPFTVTNPDYTDDVVYNRDVAKAVVLACFAPRPEHWQFSISSEHLVSQREFAAAVMEQCPNHRLTIEETTPESGRAGSNCLLSNARARAELGYRPDFPGTVGVADYLAWLARHGAS